MPSGGLSMYGGGLQLQQVTPGVPSTGNANITGTLIAGTFTENRANGTETFGLIGPIVNQNSAVIIGRGATAFNPGFAQNFNVLIGGAAQGLGGGGCVAIGYSAQVGSVAEFGGGDIAIGYDCRALRLNTDSSIAIGTSVHLKGNRCLAILPGASGANIAGFTNTILLGFQAENRAGSNTISIGNNTITNVWIGAYRIGQSTGSARLINDAVSVFGANDGKLLYSAISAPRTATLMAANSVPAGYVAGLYDFSGSVTAINTITLIPVGADTIIGGTAAIITAYGLREIQSDGVSKWLVINSR